MENLSTTKNEAQGQLLKHRHYTISIQLGAACDRGLKHVTSPLGQAWLLQTKADALLKKGDPAEAHRVLEEALQAAQTIAGKQLREKNVTRITYALKETQAAAK